MAAGDEPELIGATTLGVLKGMVCEDAMIKLPKLVLFCKLNI